MSRRSFRAFAACLLVCLGLGAQSSNAVAAPVTIAGDPTSVTWGPGHVDVFARGSDGALWHRAFVQSLGGWGAWESLGGQITGNPSAISWGQGHIDVFARGSDGGLWHRWFSNGWQPWSRIGDATFVGSPDAVSWGYGHIDVFARGTNNALIHNATVPGMCTWCGWASLGGVLTEDPDAISWGTNHLDVFVRGTDGGLHHRWFGGAGWSGWEALGGGIQGKPTPVTWGSGHVDVFVRGTDSALHHRAFMGNMCGWCPWQSLSGWIANEPGAATWFGHQRINVHVRGSNQTVHEKFFDNGWSNYWQFAPDWTLAGRPHTTSWGYGHLEVVGRTGAGDVWHRAYVNGWFPGESLGHPTDYGASAQFGGSNVQLDTQAEIDAAIAYLEPESTRESRWLDFTPSDREVLAANDAAVRWGEAPADEDDGSDAGVRDIFNTTSATTSQAEDWAPPEDVYETLNPDHPVAEDAVGPAAVVVGIVAACYKFCDDAVRVGTRVIKAKSASGSRSGSRRPRSGTSARPRSGGAGSRATPAAP